MHLCDRISSSALIRWSLSLVIAAAIATPALAGNAITLAADLDNTIYQDSGDRSNGQGPHLYAGQTFNATFRRALMHFDVSQIPVGSTILDVEITMVVNRVAPGASPAMNTLHRVNAEWGEGASNAGEPGGLGTIAEVGDATWTHRLWPTDMWTDGGDYAATVSGSSMVGAVGTYSFTGQGLIDDVQAWVDGATPNYGWILRGDESGQGGATARRFDSAESTTGGFGPALTITYEENGVPTRTTSWSSVKGRYAD